MVLRKTGHKPSIKNQAHESILLGVRISQWKKARAMPKNIETRTGGGGATVSSRGSRLQLHQEIAVEGSQCPVRECVGREGWMGEGLARKQIS